MIADNLLQNTYNELLQLALGQVDNNLDKREGSVIYDALAPACYVLAQMYRDLYDYYQNTYGLTARGQFLDYRVAERGMERYPATYAIKLGYFADKDENPMEIPLGSRFCTIDEQSPIYYDVLQPYTIDGVVQLGYYLMQCETIGTVGNEYTGDLINITSIYGVAIARLENALPLVPARDVETDEELRIRYLENLKAQAFGGNIQDYKEELLAIEGVGAVQIYPVWNGGGTVKLSIISPDYEICSTEFVSSVKELVDPVDYESQGIGFAPIGHQVTVVTPTQYVANISATVELKTGYTIEMVQGAIEQAIDNYLLEIRKEWGVMQSNFTYAGKIYVSRVANAFLSVGGVLNVTNVLVNESALDITLQEDSLVQELPVLGEVIINV